MRRIISASACLAVIAVIVQVVVPRASAQILVASYPFDGDGNDATGNGHNGVVHGATLTKDRYGNSGKAYSFDGASDFIEIPHVDELNFDGVDFTVSAWIRCPADQLTAFTGIVCKGPSEKPYPGWQLCLLDQRYLGDEVTLDSGIRSDRMNSNVGINGSLCNYWSQVVMVVQPSAGVVSLYMNGVLASTTTLNNARITTGTDNNQPVTIGTDRTRTGFFSGAIDDVNLYHGALTPLEIQALYSDGGSWPPDPTPPEIRWIDPVDFGTVGICQSSAERELDLNNVGAASVTLDTTSLITGLSIVSPRIPFTIPPGRAATLRLRWTPQRAGIFQSTFVLAATPCYMSSIGFNIRGFKASASVSAPDVIDFGQNTACSGRTIKIPVSFQSTDGSSGMLSEIVCSPPFSTTISSGEILANGIADSIPISFKPTVDESYIGSMKVTVQPCGIQKEVLLRGSCLTPRLTPPGSQFFGKVLLDTSVSRAMDFVNNGQLLVRVVTIAGAASGFAIDSTEPELPATLLPREILRVFVTYRPLLGEGRAHLRVVSPDLCGVDVAADLTGLGDDIGTSIYIRVPQLHVGAGDHFLLPIEVVTGRDLDALDLHDFTAEIAFDKTIMFPVDPILHADTGHMRTMTITGRRSAGSMTLATIPCIAALGDSDVTPIRISSFAWGDAAPLPVTTLDGSLSIDGICREGGARLFNGSVRTAIKSISPNPAGDHVTVAFEVAESGPVHLRLTDRLGDVARVIVDGDLEAGSYVSECDLSRLATGIYWCVLGTPGTHALAPVVIEK